jgi:hypothetical protein
MAAHTVIEETLAFITRQRETLLKEREVIFAEQQTLQDRLTAVNDAIAKFDVFEGKPAAARASRGRAAPSRRGSKRDGILQVLKDNPTGLSRGELLEKMGLKGNKSGEMSVSNALTALSKGKQVARKDGKYVAA